MSWTIYQLVAALVLLCGSIDAYSGETLNCSSQLYVNVQNLSGVDDSLKAGSVLFYTQEVISITGDCPSQQIFNLNNSNNNGTAVSLSVNLSSYCIDEIVCAFSCGGEPQKWLTIRVPIRRIEQYHLTFTGGPFTAAVSEAAENQTAVHLNNDLGVSVEKCMHGNGFTSYARKFKILKENSIPFTWAAETKNNSLHVAGTLDYEKIQSYNITIEAMVANNQDKRLNGTATATIMVSVTDVDDNNPRFNKSQTIPYTLDIPEHNASFKNTPLQTIPPIHAYDPDFGINMNISYQILGQVDLGLFEIGNDGCITVTRELDSEKKSEYSVLIKAAQTDKPDTATAVATLEVHVIDIDDHLPEFTSDIYTCNISEHSIVGSVICIVTAVDKDITPQNNNFTYKTWNDGLPVTVNNNGQITVKDSTELDRETTGGKLTLEVGTRTLSGAVGGNATVIINLADINDHNPVFDKDKYIFIANATDTTVGATVGQVIATDKDEGVNAEVAYSLLPGGDSSSCTGNVPSKSVFSVNSSTGEITVDDHAASFCRKFGLNIQACDNGVNRRCNFTTVEISLYNTTESQNVTKTLTVLEGLPNGTSIDFVECNGPDHSYDYHGGPEFDVDMKTGMLKTRRVLDRESNEGYSFTIDVKIGSLLLCTVNISVTVEDVNDNSPVFIKTPYKFTLPPSPKDNDKVGTIEAVDIDLFENGNVSYFLEDQRNSPFMLDSFSGVLTIKDADLINEDIMEAYVKAIDHGTPPRQSSIIVYITGASSHNMVPISTPLEVDHINGMKTKFTRDISRILNVTIDIGNVEEVTDKSSPYKSRIHIRTAQNSTISKQSFLSQVLAHYEDIRSLFYQSSANTGTEQESKSSLGPSEIGLIVMAGVILAGAMLAIFIVYRQFNNHKKYKQLYDSLTKNSSLYESQEITVDIPDDSGPDCNGTVQNQDINQNDVTSSSNLAVSAVNPVYQSDTDLTTAADKTEANEGDNTEVKTVLQQLTDSYEQDENKADTINDSGDEESKTVPPIVYANVSRIEDSQNHDYVNTNIVHAQIESAPEQEADLETVVSVSSNKDLITFDSESSADADEQRNEESEIKPANEDIGTEPEPDYNAKQVRFHSEVLDADENKLEPLKVKNDEKEVVASPDESVVINADTTNDDSADVDKDNCDTPITETFMDKQLDTNIDKDEDEESAHIPSVEDTDRLEEEIDSPQVPYIEHIQDEFYFGDMESTHF